jgi:hypothetical protein
VITRAVAHRYGGIFERGSREFTLDDFYALSLDKMDRYICLKESELILPAAGEDESSSEDDEEEDNEDSQDEDDEDEEDAHEETVEVTKEDDGEPVSSF